MNTLQQFEYIKDRACFLFRSGYYDKPDDNINIVAQIKLVKYISVSFGYRDYSNLMLLYKELKPEAQILLKLKIRKVASDLRNSHRGFRSR